MPIFIVESDIPELTPEFMELIPEHMEVIGDLFAEEKILTYAVSDDRSKWWCHIQAENEIEVMDILSQMPILPFLNPKIYGLMIYDNAEQAMPKISLN